MSELIVVIGEALKEQGPTPEARREDAVLVPNQNIENNPMHSSPWPPATPTVFQKCLDTSGKSLASFHDPELLQRSIRTRCLRGEGRWSAGRRDIGEPGTSTKASALDVAALRPRPEKALRGALTAAFTPYQHHAMLYT
jgi:hypothetical protein